MNFVIFVIERERIDSCWRLLLGMYNFEIQRLKVANLNSHAELWYRTGGL